MKKVEMNPNNDFKKNINNNYAISLCKEKLGLKVIGVGGGDLTKGDKKAILALVWQLVKLQYMKVIGDKKEEDIVAWANELVAGKAPEIKSLKDKDNLKNGKFLLHMFAAMESRAVNWDIVAEGETEEDLMNNAKYVLSVARKLGATIFCVWEDIVNVDAKQMLIFFATAMGMQADIEKAKKENM
jgi:plastin-1